MNDENGQPRNLAFNAQQRTDREIDELLGLCKGVLADGVINQEEAEFLQSWLNLNRESHDSWPANVLYERISVMLADHRLEEHEEKELLQLLVQVAGGNAGRLNVHSLSAGLPLNDPVPRVEFSGRSFCFTGKFIFGSRNKCHGEVENRGGFARDAIKQDLSYLVIGIVGSRDWRHSTFGRKIEKAVEYRNNGVPLAIVSEEHFIKSLV